MKLSIYELINNINKYKLDDNNTLDNTSLY